MARNAVERRRCWRRLWVSVAHEVGVEGWVVGSWHGGGHGWWIFDFGCLGGGTAWVRRVDEWRVGWEGLLVLRML